MTYWRRSNYPASGHADVPSDVWREFQRMRDAFMDIDQNNVLASGVDRATITRPDNSNRGGVSATVDALGAFAYDSDTVNPVTLTSTSDSRTWKADPGVSISVYSQWESWWIVGAGASWQAGVIPTADQFINVELVPTSGSGVGFAISSGLINPDQLRTATSSFGAVRLPPGQHTIGLAYRAAWTDATGDVTYDDRNLFAFALYR